MSGDSFTTRALVEDDWQQWKRIRLESLQDSPAAFGSSFEEESVRDDATFKKVLSDTTVFGAFIDGEVVGVVGIMCHTSVRLRHRGKIFGVYTTPSARGKGICKTLMKLAIEEARKRVLWIELHVWTTNTAAFQLYSSLGFVTYMTELRSLRVSDDEIVDYYGMRLDF